MSLLEQDLDAIRELTVNVSQANLEAVINECDGLACMAVQGFSGIEERLSRIETCVSALVNASTAKESVLLYGFETLAVADKATDQNAFSGKQKDRF